MFVKAEFRGRPPDRVLSTSRAKRNQELETDVNRHVAAAVPGHIAPAAECGIRSGTVFVCSETIVTALKLAMGPAVDGWNAGRHQAVCVPYRLRRSLRLMDETIGIQQ